MSNEDLGYPSAAFAAFGNSAAFAAFGNAAAFAAFAPQAAFGGGGESPVMAEALLRNRDGVIGANLALGATVAPLHQANPDNLALLAGNVRASLWLSELGSRVAIAPDCRRPDCDQAAQGLADDDTLTATVWAACLYPRPGRPPRQTLMPLAQMTRPGTAQLRARMRWVAGYADIRADRAAEILTQIASPAPFYATIARMDPARTPYTLELLAAGMGFANYVEMQMKYLLSVKRPIEYSPQIQPMIPTPSHGSLPSGHATEAFLTARLLWKLLRAAGQPSYAEGGYWGEMLMRTAARIAVNRTVAGVHFPVDSAAGALLGLTLADFMSGLGEGAASWTAARFHGPQFNQERDFDWHGLYDAATDTQARRAANYDIAPPAGNAANGGAWAVTRTISPRNSPLASAPLQWLWAKAVAEWRDPALAPTTPCT